MKYIETLRNVVQAPTVDGVMSVFTKAIKGLQDVANHHQQKSTDKLAQGDVLMGRGAVLHDEAADHDAEAERALQMKAKLEAMLNG